MNIGMFVCLFCMVKPVIQMSTIFILIGISIVIAGLFLAAFLWAVRSGQYDDDFGPSVRILFDNDSKNKKSKTDS